MARIEQQLDKLGVELPEVAKPAGVYVPAVRSGDYVYTSGQLPFVNGELKVTGKLGGGVSVEDGYEAAKLAAVNGLAAVKAVIGDDALYGDSLGPEGTDGETYIGSIMHNVTNLVRAWGGTVAPVPEILEAYTP